MSNKNNSVNGTQFLFGMAKMLGKAYWDYNTAPIRAGMWALARPQQALFQGARKGADAFARHLTESRNAGKEPSTWEAIKRSASDFGKGFTEGLTGGGKDIIGRDLVEGLSDNPWVERRVGLGLDFFADPGSLGVNVAGSAAQKLFRTGRTLSRLGMEQKALLDRIGLRKYFLDIPTVPKNHRYPLVIKTKRPPQ